MPIVSSNVRRYAKKPITMIEKAASAQLGGLTKARMGIKHPAVTSPLQSQINLAQSMGRNPDISAPPQDQTTQLTQQAGQSIQPVEVEVAEESGENLSIAQYVTILTILPQTIKQQPIRMVFAPPALSDFSNKSIQANMPQTAALTNAAAQGSNITTIEVETTAKGELQSAQSAQGATSAPQAQSRLNILQSKLAQAQRNPFVNINQGELAELYDLDRSSLDGLIGGGQSG